jgi:microcystin-dependent protein
MSEPFLAEIRIVGFNFAPRGWAFCDGQILPINQNQSLYSLLGTMYGGDGRTTFALPDLRGRVPIHTGNGHTEGQKSGEETHTLSSGEMAAHQHSFGATSQPATGNTSANGYLAGSAPNEVYHTTSTTANMNADELTRTGSGQAHDNMQPYLAVNFCIALQGLFPSRN